MNFDDAIRAHAEWKMKLANYLKNPDKSLNAFTVGVDNQCALGKWIYGEGAKHAALPEFAELKKAHARFHTAAGAIIKKADAGEKMTEEVALGSQSEYNQSSTLVTQLILKLRAKI